MDYFKNKFGGVFENRVFVQENANEKRQNFKQLVKVEQLKALFNYLKSKSQGGLYKKEGNRVIGECFNVGKDLIGKLIKELENGQYIAKLNELDKYYKILKEDFE